jgi:hypothetical protein
VIFVDEVACLCRDSDPGLFSPSLPTLSPVGIFSYLNVIGT